MSTESKQVQSDLQSIIDIYSKLIYTLLETHTNNPGKGIAGMKSIISATVFTVCTLSAGIASADVDAKAGELVYNRACKMCHGTGMARSPKTGDKAAWAARIARGAEELTNNAIKGIRAMPPRGGCGSCSNEDIANAVAFIMEQSK